MLKVTPKCPFDLSDLQPDFTVRVAGRSFPTYRFLLITQSDFFKKLLTSGFKERELKEYNFATGDPSIFALIIKTIQGESFDLPDLQTALSYLVYVNYFQVKNIEVLQIIRSLTVPPELFLLFIDALDKIYPEGFSQEVINIIARSVRLTTPLTAVSPELQEAIIRSPGYRFWSEHRGFTDTLLQITENHKKDPFVQYVRSAEKIIISARSLAEAFLKLRQHYYRLELSSSEDIIPELPNRVPVTTIQSPYQTQRVISLREFRQRNDYIRRMYPEIKELSSLHQNLDETSIEDVEVLLNMYNNRLRDGYELVKYNLI